MKNVKQYYKELGRLVYAVAMADGSIQPEERQALHETVLKELAANEMDADSSGMNKAFYVDFEFDFSENQHPKMTDAVRSFNQFVKTNSERGDKALLDRSVNLLERVAMAYTRQREKDILEVVKDNIHSIKDSVN